MDHKGEFQLLVRNRYGKDAEQQDNRNIELISYCH